jgi:amino acid transporter
VLLWLAVLVLAFFVPYAVVTARLAAELPEEGGIAVWLTGAVGPLPSAAVILCYWITNPIWIGGSLTIVTLDAVGQSYGSLTGVAKYAAAAAFIWIAVLAASIWARFGKWFVIAGGWLRVGVVAWLTITTIAYGIEHGLRLHRLSGGVSYEDATLVVPILIFGLVGLEIPSAAAEETKNAARAIPRSVRRAAAWTVALYAVPLVAILVAVPDARRSGFAGFTDAIFETFRVYGGAGGVLRDVVVGAFVLGLASSGTAWLMGADRSLAIAAKGGLMPARLGTFASRTGTPVVANVFSGLVATATMVASFAISQGNASRYFSAALSLALSTNIVAYVVLFAVFPSILKRIARRVSRLERTLGLVGVLACSIALAMVLWPGLGAADSSAALPDGFTADRGTFEAIQLGGLGVVLAAGVVCGAVARRSRLDSRVGEIDDPATV